jgi:histidinol-phosphate aminotransferase
MRLNHAWLPPPVGRWAVRTDLVVITQPNNPTGNLFPRPWVEDLVAVAPLVLVDETYIDFSDAPSLVGTSRSNVCVFRSFSKAYGLAGARVGCLVGSPSLIGRLRERQRFFSVDRISLRAAIAVLEDPDFLKQTVSHVRELRPRYTAMLRSHPRLFQRVAETQCNFVLAQCTASTEVNALLTDLLGLGIRLADLRPLQLPGWVRIGIGGAGELDDVDDVLTTIEAALAPAAPDDQLTHAP